MASDFIKLKSEKWCWHALMKSGQLCDNSTSQSTTFQVLFKGANKSLHFCLRNPSDFLESTRVLNFHLLVLDENHAKFDGVANFPNSTGFSIFCTSSPIGIGRSLSWNR